MFWLRVRNVLVDQHLNPAVDRDDKKTGIKSVFSVVIMKQLKQEKWLIECRLYRIFFQCTVNSAWNNTDKANKVLDGPIDYFYNLHDLLNKRDCATVSLWLVLGRFLFWISAGKFYFSVKCCGFPKNFPQML
jgi:hypothetical protein